MKIFKLVKQNIANIFSFIRILFVPLLIKTATDETKDSFVLLSVSLFSTDVLDGVLARKLKIVSTFGRKIDALADYIFYSSMIGILIVMYKDTLSQYLMFIIAPLLFFSIPKFVGLYFMKRFSTMHFMVWRIVGFLLFAFLISLLLFKFNLFILIILNIICFIGFVEESLIYIIFKEQTDENCTSLLQLIKKKKR